MSLYSVNTSFTETNLSWLIFESINVWSIKTSILFLIQILPTILSYFFFLFFNYWLYFSFTAVIPQVFNPTAGVVIPVGTWINKAKEEIEKHPGIIQPKISDDLCLLNYFVMK